jgi:hypothetical protein
VFGKECEVFAAKKLNEHKVERPIHHWRFGEGSAGSSLVSGTNAGGAAAATAAAGRYGLGPDPLEVLATVRGVLAKRSNGFSSLKALGKQFRIMDRHGDNRLSTREMADGLAVFLRGYGLRLSAQETDALFRIVDRNGDGWVSYDEFLRAIRGEMNAFRLALVRRAYDALAGSPGAAQRSDEACQAAGTANGTGNGNGNGNGNNNSNGNSTINGNNGTGIGSGQSTKSAFLASKRIGAGGSTAPVGVAPAVAASAANAANAAHAAASGDIGVTLDEIAAKYDVSGHPKVLDGSWTKERALREFMRDWDRNGDDTVTHAEFREYYQWVSPSMESDDYFALVMVNSWRLSDVDGIENTACRRVLVTHRGGKQTVEEIKNDLGISAQDTDKMMDNLRKQGLDPVRVELYG